MSHSTSALDATPEFVHFRALKRHRNQEFWYNLTRRGIMADVGGEFRLAPNRPPQDAR
jgi:hypothetical protein